MVDIVPFVCTRYGPQLADDLARLVTPPYDVIDRKLQQELYDRHPNNLVRIDYAQPEPEGSEFENHYARAGALWQQWKKEGVLVEEPRKAYYVYEQEFELADGRRLTRRGFFAAVRLEDFAEGGIRAHEQTFSGPKADRFRLMRATHSNMSPIFCVYDDPARKIDKLLAEGIKGQKPVVAELDGITHRLWVAAKPNVVAGLTKAMEDQTLFIADGHHRYETALLYRDEMRQTFGRDNGHSPYDYTMMYLNNIHDDGLIVLPTHRILSKETCIGLDCAEAIEDMGEYFDVTPLELDAANLEAEARRYTELLAEAGRTRTSFIIMLPKGRAWLASLKPEADPLELIDEDDLPRPIAELDVTILHKYIISRATLGNPEIELDHDDVHYVKDAVDVLRAMTTCRYGIAYLLNPTRVEQVCAIAREGLRMPHKSTYFYPKLLTGMVMRDMNSAW